MAWTQCPDFHLQDAGVTPRARHEWQRGRGRTVGSVRSRRTGESRVRVPGRARANPNGQAFPPEPPQGFYLAVEREGDVGAGDAIERLARSERRLTVADVVTLYAADSANQSLLESASDHPSLPTACREYFRKRLWAPDA